MSLNHLLSDKPLLSTKFKELSADKLLLKLDNDEVVHFTLPSKGLEGEVIRSKGDGTFDWFYNDVNIPTVYIQTSTFDYTFVNAFNLQFDLHRTGNFILENSIDMKILLKIGLIYQWMNGSYSPDFVVNVLVNNVIVYENQEGLSDYSNKANKLNDNIILDVNSSDVIHVRLTKTGSDDVNLLRVMKNSFYSIELL